MKTNDALQRLTASLRADADAGPVGLAGSAERRRRDLAIEAEQEMLALRAQNEFVADAMTYYREKADEDRRAAETDNMAVRAVADSLQLELAAWRKAAGLIENPESLDLHLSCQTLRDATDAAIRVQNDVMSELREAASTYWDACATAEGENERLRAIFADVEFAVATGLRQPTNPGVALVDAAWTLAGEVGWLRVQLADCQAGRADEKTET